MTKNKSLIIDTTYVSPLFGIEISLGKDVKEKLKLLW